MATLNRFPSSIFYLHLSVYTALGTFLLQNIMTEGNLRKSLFGFPVPENEESIMSGKDPDGQQALRQEQEAEGSHPQP